MEPDSQSLDLCQHPNPKHTLEPERHSMDLHQLPSTQQEEGSRLQPGQEKGEVSIATRAREKNRNKGESKQGLAVSRQSKLGKTLHLVPTYLI